LIVVVFECGTRIFLVFHGRDARATAEFHRERNIMNIDPAPQRAPYQVSQRQYSVSHQMVTTAFELPNFRVMQTLGVVRGIVVRSRNVFATIGASFQQVVGGNITIWTRMCEETRSDAFDIMVQHASEIGANAIIGARYDTTEISTGVTEVLCYGTAVIVEPTDSSYRG
jgi:uncharacterized protein YbjQ (UPF0145 family)